MMSDRAVNPLPGAELLAKATQADFLAAEARLAAREIAAELGRDELRALNLTADFEAMRDDIVSLAVRLRDAAGAVALNDEDRKIAAFSMLLLMHVNKMMREIRSLERLIRTWPM